MNKLFFIVSSAVAVAVGAFIFWGPTTGHRKRKGPIIGLRNLGTTCFLNALLQALASCAIFIDWLELREEHDSISQSLACVLKILSTEVEPNSPSDGIDAYSPLEIITSLRRKGWIISPGEQDAHELFQHLILTIEEETQKYKGKVYGCLSDALIPASSIPPNIVPSTPSLVMNSGKATVLTAKKGYLPFSTSTPCKSNGDISTGDYNLMKSDRGDVSPMMVNSRYDINGNCKPLPFTGFLTSQTHCTECGFKSVLRYDKFDSLSLHLPPLELHYNRHTLTDLLDRFVKTEMVSGVSCDGCNKSTPPEGPTVKTTALKSLSIGKLPRCLCIHIPRTLIRNNGEPYKRQDFVDFPEFLVMDPYTQNSMMRELKLKREKIISNNLDQDITIDTCIDVNSDHKLMENNVVKCTKQSNDEGVNVLKIRKANHIFRIKAVIVHKGDCESGHFVTYRRGPLKSHKRHRSNQTHQNSHVDGRWYLTSDAIVRDASLCEALESPAYMLFYEKCANEDNSL